MTIEQVCERFGGITPASLKKNFARYQTKILEEYGLHLEKEGRGVNTNYYIKEETDEKLIFTKELALYENECRSLVPTELILANEELYYLLVILFSPMGVFRGNYKMLLQYAEKPITELEKVKIIIERLVEKEYIRRIFDTTTDEGYFVLASRRDIEKECEFNIPIKELRQVINIAKEHKMQSWIPIFKIWAAISTLDGQVSTCGQLAAMTGLTDNQVKYYSNKMKESNMFTSKKLYMNAGTEEIRCLGTEKTVIADWAWGSSEEI